MRPGSASASEFCGFCLAFWRALKVGGLCDALRSGYSTGGSVRPLVAPPGAQGTIIWEQFPRVVIDLILEQVFDGFKINQDLILAQFGTYFASHLRP